MWPAWENQGSNEASHKAACLEKSLGVVAEPCSLGSDTGHLPTVLLVGVFLPSFSLLLPHPAAPNKYLLSAYYIQNPGVG